MPITTLNYARPPFKRFIVSVVSQLLEKRRFQIVQRRLIPENQRVEGSMWPVLAHTMVGMKRLDNLQHCIETVLADAIEGDLIETGVWRGGASIFMRAVLAAHGVEDRRVFVADSFEGLPAPDVATYPVDKDDQHHLHEIFAVSQEEVEDNFRKYGLLDGQVIFLKGWFKDTLPQAPIKNLCILRLDGDMYGSTMEAMEILYPKLSRGGFCIVDDYSLERCRAAVTDYRMRHSIGSAIMKIDASSAYWRKE